MNSLRIFGALRRIFNTLCSRPMTLNFPAQRLEPLKDYRGRQILDRDLCNGCGACVVVCPNEAIVLVEIAGKKLPTIHLGKCCFCALCEEKCPRKALLMTPEAMVSVAERNQAIYAPEKLSQPEKH